MQIHEVTVPVREGLFDAFRKPESVAADAAAKLTAQGYGIADQDLPDNHPLKTLSVRDAIATVRKNTAQQQYIKGLVAQWARVAPSQATPTTPTSTTPTSTTPTPTTSTPTQSVTLGGKRLDPKNPKDAQVLAAMQAQGKLEEAPLGNLGQRAATARVARTAQRNPGSAPANTTSFNSAQVDPYQEDFMKWTAEKLRTVVPGTGQTITLDQVIGNQADIKDEMDRALAQVMATAGDAQKNAVAVNNYLTIAVAGIAREAKKLKMKYRNDNNNRNNNTTGQTIVTQPEIQNMLSQEARLTSTQINDLKKIMQDPAKQQAFFKLMGAPA